MADLRKACLIAEMNNDLLPETEAIFYLANLFSAPELKAQVHYCDHALSIVRPSVCPSVVRRKLFTFSTSPLKPLNRIQRKLTRSKNSTFSTKFLFFRADRKNKMAALASDWLIHFRLLLWNCWSDFNATWQEARSQHPLPSLSVSGRSVNKKGRPGRFILKVARYTQVHDMWPFGPLVLFLEQKGINSEYVMVD